MNIALIGHGKMGKSIEQEIRLNHTDLSILYIFDEENPITDTTNLSGVDVAIEFTNPDSAAFNIQQCIDQGVQIVSGTTGIEDYIKNLPTKYSSDAISIVYSRNFSLGVALVSELVHLLSEKTSGLEYQVEIKETHHAQKMDKPSGTAIQLANEVIKAHSSEYNDYHLCQDQASKDKSIPIKSIRIDDVIGKHEVKFSSELESISIVHEANNRALFTQGVIKATKWLTGKKGIFTMRDVLGFS